MLSAIGNKASLQRTLALFIVLLFLVAPVQAAEQPIFGPVTYDVKARYGRENRYQETIAASEGLFLVKIQNGEHKAKRPDLLSFSVNGEMLLAEGQYGYPFLACFVQLSSSNVVELTIRDFTPPALKKPPLTGRNAVVTILPATAALPGVSLGVHAWEDVNLYVDALLKIRSSEAQALALAAADLKRDPAARAEAMGKLAALKDSSTRAFVLSRYYDPAETSAMRGEAVFAVGAQGEIASVPMLVQGMLDPDESVRKGSIRALSLFKEEDTREHIVKTFARMERTMRIGVANAFMNVGWRPVGTLLELAASPDPDVANAGIAMLAGSTDRTAVDALLAYFENTGPREIRLIIAALGGSKDSRALEPLSRLANDPAKGRGLEATLGAALAALGEPGAAEPIAAMIKRTNERSQVYPLLLESYKKLTGTDYAKPGDPGGKRP